VVLASIQGVAPIPFSSVVLLLFRLPTSFSSSSSSFSSSSVPFPPSVLWLKATLIYTSPYPWDIAIVKIIDDDKLINSGGNKNAFSGEDKEVEKVFSVKHGSLIITPTNKNSNNNNNSNNNDNKMMKAAYLLKQGFTTPLFDENNKNSNVRGYDDGGGDIRVGEDVYVIGNAIFTPEARLRPTFTKGVISKVIREKQQQQQQQQRQQRRRRYQFESPLITTALMTTAAVHQGNSGGIVVSKRGQLLGMVTCNIAHFPSKELPGHEILSPSSSLSSSIAHARMNMSIPINILKPFFNLLQLLLSMKDDRATSTAADCTIGATKYRHHVTPPEMLIENWNEKKKKKKEKPGSYFAADIIPTKRRFDEAFISTGMLLPEGNCIWNTISPSSHNGDVHHNKRDLLLPGPQGSGKDKFLRIVDMIRKKNAGDECQQQQQHESFHDIYERSSIEDVCESGDIGIRARL